MSVDVSNLTSGKLVMFTVVSYVMTIKAVFAIVHTVVAKMNGFSKQL